MDHDIRKDEFAVRNNYVAVTPLSFDLTAYRFMAELETWQLNK
jgi:5'-nucleotidase